MARSGIEGLHVLLTGDQTIPAYNADNTKKYALKLLNFTAYNDLIFAQEDVVFFHIIEEVKTKDTNFRDARLAWTKLSRKFEQQQEIPRQDCARNFLSLN